MRFSQIFFISFLLFPGSWAQATSQNIGFAYLDFGILDGQLDPLDHIIDLNKDCDLDSLVISGGEHFSEVLLKDQNFRRASAFKSSAKILTELGYTLEGGSERVNEHFVIPAYSNHNSSTTFILLPEAHAYALPQFLIAKNGVMEFKRTILALGWIEQNSSQILNLKEGIKNLSLPLIPEFSPSGDVYTDAYNLVPQSPFITLVNIYQNSPRIYSSNLERPFDLFFNALLMAGFRKGMSYEEALNLLEKEGFNVKESFLSMVQETWKILDSWPDEQFSKSAKTICEDRSRRMAIQALQEAKERTASIVFLTFGLVHSKGIMNYLDQQKISYALVLANAKPLK